MYVDDFNNKSYLLGIFLVIIALVFVGLVLHKVEEGPKEYVLVDTVYNYKLKFDMTHEFCEWYKRGLVRENSEYAKWPDRLQCVKGDI